MNYQKPDKICVHCSVTPDNPKSDIGVTHIKRWHVEVNGWRDIGYHYVIKRDGKIERGRPENVQGAGVKGFNEDVIHVCLIGTKHFTDIQVQKLVHLYNDVNKRWNINYNKVSCHYQYTDKKTCPNIPVSFIRFILKYNNKSMMLPTTTIDEEKKENVNEKNKVQAKRSRRKAVAALRDSAKSENQE